LTAILGYWDGETAWLAADGRWTDGAGVTMTDRARKILRFGESLLAFSGEGRALTLMSLHCDRLNSAEAGGGIEALAEEFRNLVREDEYQSDTARGAKNLGYSLLLADRTGVCYGDCAGALTRLAVSRPWGIGSGGERAEGAASALLDAGVDAGNALRTAIIITSRYCPHCGGEPLVLAAGAPASVEGPAPC
jgi:ATP-dependent protease HslVU (ClpYQ) peptidase subunit